MKSIACLILAMVVSVVSPAQRKHHHSSPPAPPYLTEEQRDSLDRNRECVYREIYTPRQRGKLYPFRRAHTVMLIAFDKNTVRGEGLDDALYHQMPLKRKRLVREQADEVVTLNPQGIDSLTDLLNNWTYRGEFGIDVYTQCFIPRNAIVFMNRRGVVMDYFEICFECTRIRRSNKKKMKAIIDCSGHLDMLKQFFVQHGITIGTLTWAGKEDLETAREEEEQEQSDLKEPAEPEEEVETQLTLRAEIDTCDKSGKRL